MAVLSYNSDFGSVMMRLSPRATHWKIMLRAKARLFMEPLGTVNGNIPVHAGILRETNGFSVQFSKNGSLVFLDIIRKLQYLMHFLQSHKTGSPIGSLCGIIQVPAPVCYFPRFGQIPYA